MAKHSVSQISAAIGISVLLSGCLNTATAKSPTFRVADGSSATVLLDVAAANGRKFRARTSRVNDSTAIVTYSGKTRDFAVCSKGGVTQNGVALDTRTTLVAKGPRLVAETLYIATSARPNSASVVCDGETSARLPDGTTCRATGQLERQLVGVK